MVYRAVVLNVLTYGLEACCLLASDARRLEVFHLRCLRSLLGGGCPPGLSNASVLARCRMPSVDLLLRRSRLRWLGHVGRMDFARVPKQLLFARLEGPRPPGRPPKPWSQLMAGEVAHVASVNPRWPVAQPWTKWQAVCPGRRGWRRVIKAMSELGGMGPT